MAGVTEGLTPTDLVRVNRLSEYQVGVLRWLLNAYRRVEARSPEENRYSAIGAWGVAINRRPPGTSRSESAADSRALRRLEDRGLIERRNQAAGDKYSGRVNHDPYQHRTTHVRFTPAGRELAERLNPADHTRTSEVPR